MPYLHSSVAVIVPNIHTGPMTCEHCNNISFMCLQSGCLSRLGSAHFHCIQFSKQCGHPNRCPWSIQEIHYSVCTIVTEEADCSVQSGDAYMYQDALRLSFCPTVQTFLSTHCKPDLLNTPFTLYPLTPLSSSYAPQPHPHPHPSPLTPQPHPPHQRTQLDLSFYCKPGSLALYKIH